MEKILRFRKHLVPLILSGQKSVTWRLFDDKNLAVGDVVSFEEFVTNRAFAKAKITDLAEKQFKDLQDKDWVGHEQFGSLKEMYATYSTYYKQPVNEQTLVKVLNFVLLD